MRLSIFTMYLCSTFKLTFEVDDSDGRMVTEIGHITVLHGADATVLHSLIEEHVAKYFGGSGVPLEAMNDVAVNVMPP
jgi:hypothetical protein